MISLINILDEMKNDYSKELYSSSKVITRQFAFSTGNPYMFLVMQTRTQMSQNSYYPYLKVASEAHLSKDDMGQRLIFGDEHIICTNNSYLRRKNVGDEIVDTIVIPQNEDGIDTEDRITLLKNYIKANLS